MCKKNKKISFILGIWFALFSLSACGEPPIQGDAKAGENKSTICSNCHGENGISRIPIYPNLRGQKEQYLVLALKAYRSGERVNMAMTSHAQKLTDQDIADLAAYYANLGKSKINQNKE
ncbi:c-type cytochrome [Glaciecola sp. 1036]|uniref:c-type cytochrome n=1 Tax=Alteromonadaceae TaxID=72275 RepID=UPI003D014858